MRAGEPRVESLRDAGFRGEIRTEAPLAPFTTWRIGGPAEILATPEDALDLVHAVRWASHERIPWRILGNGSNLLIRDEGVRGLVLRLRRTLDGLHVEGTTILAGAGASFPAVANAAASHGLAGLEFAAGIPGSVGGAIVMNAGWHQYETGNLVASVDFLTLVDNQATLFRHELDYHDLLAGFARDLAALEQTVGREVLR